MNRKFSLNGEKTSKGFPFIGKLSNMPLQRQNISFIPLILIEISFYKSKTLHHNAAIFDPNKVDSCWLCQPEIAM